MEWGGRAPGMGASGRKPTVSPLGSSWATQGLLRPAFTALGAPEAAAPGPAALHLGSSPKEPCFGIQSSTATMPPWGEAPDALWECRLPPVLLGLWDASVLPLGLL